MVEHQHDMALEEAAARAQQSDAVFPLGAFVHDIEQCISRKVLLRTLSTCIIIRGVVDIMVPPMNQRTEPAWPLGAF